MAIEAAQAGSFLVPWLEGVYSGRSEAVAVALLWHRQWQCHRPGQTRSSGWRLHMVSGRRVAVLVALAVVVTQVRSG